jgi:hypothetical protein
MCLAAALTRLEVGTAMDVLCELAPKLRLVDEVRWRHNTMIPGTTTPTLAG